MEQQSSVQQSAVRPYQHIYNMKLEWLQLLADYKNNPSLLRDVSAFQAAYYAVRKNVDVDTAIKKLFLHSTAGKAFYQLSAFHLTKLEFKAKEIFKRFPAPVVYPGK